MARIEISRIPAQSTMHRMRAKNRLTAVHITFQIYYEYESVMSHTEMSRVPAQPALHRHATQYSSTIYITIRVMLRVRISHVTHRNASWYT